MKKLTLTEMIEKLDEWIENTQGDINSDWIEEQDKKEMQQQLQNLIISKGNLELIMNTGEQIFNSVINK